VCVCAVAVNETEEWLEAVDPSSNKPFWYNPVSVRAYIYIYIYVSECV